jgi:hypothetical protein
MVAITLLVRYSNVMYHRTQLCIQPSQGIFGNFCSHSVNDKMLLLTKGALCNQIRQLMYFRSIFYLLDFKIIETHCLQIV